MWRACYVAALAGLLFVAAGDWGERGQPGAGGDVQQADWMGHRDYKTTSIYVDYAPDPSQGAKWATKAFGEAPREPTRREESLPGASEPWPAMPESPQGPPRK